MKLLNLLLVLIVLFAYVNCNNVENDSDDSLISLNDDKNDLELLKDEDNDDSLIQTEDTDKNKVVEEDDDDDDDESEEDEEAEAEEDEEEADHVVKQAKRLNSKFRRGKGRIPKLSSFFRSRGKLPNPKQVAGTLAADVIAIKAFLSSKFPGWKKKAQRSSVAKKKLGNIKRFFCFAPSTLVDMADGSMKRMDEVKLGEKLSNGALITGVMQFMSSGAQLYDYRGVVVTGEHKVLEQGQFVAVRNSKIGQLLNLQLDSLYDLDTSNHRIMIRNMTFADYSEVHRLPKVERIEMKQLNQ